MSRPEQIIVLGAGPAGATAALGLKALGYPVLVVSSPRSYASCEGLSERALAGLRNAGCRRAAASLPQPTPRFACWNGLANSANQERLALREKLDQALLEDLENNDVRLVSGRIGRLEHLENGDISVTVSEAGGAERVLNAHFVIEARGRSAPGGGAERARGPATVSLLQRWRGPPTEPKSTAVSFADGWAWLASTGDGQRFTQITVAADAADFPKRPALRDYFFRYLNSIEEAREFYSDAETVGELVARSSTSVLYRNPIQHRVMRIGDAALAGDPLSGNGIFNALSTALIAPSIVNTIIQSPLRSALAEQFYQNRIGHTFQRLARMGRDFYALEQRWPDRPFWQQRAAWPDREPAHNELTPALVGIELKPVVENDQIQQREVAVTTDQPLGVWHVAGIELAPVIRALPKEPRRPDLETLRQLPALSTADSRQFAAVAAWLNKYLC